jgi:hypothetical protein
VPPRSLSDGGIRRGSNIVKPVDRFLDWFHADTVRTMSLLGVGAIDDLDRSLLDQAGHRRGGRRTTPSAMHRIARVHDRLMEFDAHATVNQRFG